ncbi:hypothetical protein AB0M94_31595 [Streptomyces xanthochromogenes]|uniref:hypothetical protein n=1 Tax=Streptomyces xanthochromogenes TaxID=67384 RepID=UPI00342704CE
MIHSTDADFRVCQISFHTLLEIQLEAEELGLAARWTSLDALRGQVEDGPALLQPLVREEREGEVRSYRCLLLFSSPNSENSGGIVTIDLAPGKFKSLKRIDQDPEVRKAFSRLFSLAAGGISMVSKT